MTSSINETLTTDNTFEESLLDGAQGVIGTDLARVEGPLKVSGSATYSAEYPVENLAYGYLVLATVARATVVRLEDAEARKVPGVIDVFTDSRFLRHSEQSDESMEPGQANKEVLFAGQPIALVVAETYEAAREAGELVRATYAEHPSELTFADRADEAQEPPPGVTGPAHTDKGDLERAMANADVRLDVTYTTPSQSSSAMEPHAAIAQWHGDELIIHSSQQLLHTDREQLAKQLGVDASHVRLVAPYVGGGFGSKLFIGPEAVACALAARALGRPIKTVMTRQQVFQCTVRRTNTEQRIRLAATRAGKLVGIGHDSLTTNLQGQDFFEPCGVGTRLLYAAEHRRVHHDIVRMNWLAAGSMRAPGEGAGTLAFETAMDEMAEKLGLDPVVFRTLNEPDRNPERGVPHSSRQLVRCMDVGAERFGWSKRNSKPAQVRQGEWLVGMGMAAAVRTNRMAPSQARVTLTSTGRAVVETDMTDIGTGTYTILAQITAELLGLPIDSVEVSLGDTEFPAAYGSGGSIGAGSSGSAVYVACDAIRKQICQQLDCAAWDLTLKDGRARVGTRSVSLAALAGEGIVAEGSVKPGENEKLYSQASYGAHFVEVAVNAVTGEVRVRRMLGVFAAGRILNLKTARSQCLGGMVFGIGAALTEELVHDPRTGKPVNHDLAEYHIPVNADVPQMEVILLEERDRFANPLQSKGLGELSISGAGAAINNAIYNACGVRVRDYPVTLDKLLDRLPAV